MKVALPLSFNEPRPGQFVMLKIANLNEPFLGRPFSIYSFKRSKLFSEMNLLYHIVGRGTQIMAGLIDGSEMEVHGPLGGSFDVDPERSTAVLIAGGIGIAPLSLLAKHLCMKFCHPQRRIFFYLGAQTAGALVGLNNIENLDCNIKICTDDGTSGRKALVTRAFQEDLPEFNPADTAFYACGPQAMLKALKRLLKGSEYFCQVSMEERMACGIGACLGCVAAIRNEEGALSYKRICKEGPVFNLADVIWE